MKRRGSAWRLWTCVFVAVAVSVLPAQATYENARAVGKRCSTCHAGHRPDASTLNAAGRFFLANRTLPGPATASATAPSAATHPATAASAATPARAAKDPATIFVRHCAPCHGKKGEGTATARPLAEPKLARTTTEIAAVVRKGVPRTSMSGFAGMLSAAEIRALAEYVVAMRTH